MLPLAPLMLPLKRLASIFRSGTVIFNPKFDVYIIYIEIQEEKLESDHQPAQMPLGFAVLLV